MTDKPTRLFIIGCPRSGTTWTALLLAQHPEVQGCQQVGGLYALDAFSRWWAKGERQASTRYCSSVIRFDKTETGAAVPRYEALMTRDEMLTISRHLLDELYAVVARKNPHCRVIVNTTPENVRRPELMAELMPDAKFLHVIRDPRSVFTSHRHGTSEFGARFPTDPAGSAEFWKRDVLSGRRLAALSPNYREIRYETLKTNGALELKRLFEWIGLRADAAWCDSVVANTTVDNLRSAKGTPTAFFRSGASEGWQRELSRRDVHIVEYCARDLMADLGYKRTLRRSAHKPTALLFRGMAERVARVFDRALGRDWSLLERRTVG